MYNLYVHKYVTYVPTILGHYCTLSSKNKVVCPRCIQNKMSKDELRKKGKRGEKDKRKAFLIPTLFKKFTFLRNLILGHYPGKD